MVELKLENLHIYYDDFHAVKGVNLTVKDGEILTLLGPSGCGKTTILRSIAGFVEPREGRILLGDKDITFLPPRERDSGMIFQNYALWPHMSIEANVGYGLKMRKVDKEERHERVMDIIKQVQLEGQEKKNPGQLSGGQQQRVALARALVIRPTILLCDEPLSNLDFKLRVELRTEIRKLTKRLGVTTVYVTHDQTEALAISDKIAVINEGTIEQVGSPLEIFNDPDTLFVANFLGENNNLNGEVTKVEQNHVEVEVPSGDTIEFEGIVDPIEVGDKVKLVVRHSDIVINGGKKNTLEGTITNLAFMGKLVQVEVGIKNLNPITVNVYDNPVRVMRMGLGSTIKISLPEKKVYIFKGGKRVR